MELNVKETSLSHIKKLYETATEQSIDTDFTMPDYYPEVEKILKCLTDVNIMSAQCVDNTVTIGGQAVMTVLFVGADGALNSFSHTCPFVKVCDVNDSASGTVKVNTKVNYLNIKATGPRKVELHGSLSLSFSVCEVIRKPLLDEISVDGVYTRNAEFSAIEPMSYITKSIFCEDEISVGQNKPAVSKILRTSYDAKITECKYLSEKAVIKGDLHIEMLYCPSDNGKPIKLSEIRGFSCVLDCPGLNNDVSFDCSAVVESFEPRPKTSLDGEVRNIAYEAKIGVCLLPFITVQKTVTVDAFSCKNHADIQKETVIKESLLEHIKDSFVIKKTVDSQGAAFSDIIDIWSRPIVDYASTESGDIIVKGEVVISVLGTAGAETVFLERIQDYEYRYGLDSSAETTRFNPTVAVMTQNASLNQDGSVDVSVELSVEGDVYSVSTVEAVCKIRVEDSCIAKDDTAVILYFAEDETPWAVAEKYRTSPEAVCRVNGLDSVDEKCSKMLLVPIV